MLRKQNRFVVGTLGLSEDAGVWSLRDELMGRKSWRGLADAGALLRETIPVLAGQSWLH